MEQHIKELPIYTDGSCHGNPGPGAWAIAIPELKYQYAAGVQWTTNNRMELAGILAALRWAISHKVDVVIYSDSQYAVNIMSNWLDNWAKRKWRTNQGKPAKNIDLLYLLKTASDRMISDNLTVRYVWLEGHAGNENNELCNELANANVPTFDLNQKKDDSPVIQSQIWDMIQSSHLLEGGPKC